jgi:diaminopimelate decarboxylase
MKTYNWSSLRNLEEQYGESFYLIDLEKFKRHYARFVAAFRSIYSKSNIAYSYKTNYTPALCKLVNDFDGYAEVVSGLEFDLALRIGVAPARIIFNGPYKTKADVERALLSGSIVNLDSLRELKIVEDVARHHKGAPLTVGIRCNLNLGTGYTSRFGFDAEGDDLSNAILRLQGADSCSVIGLHCHFLTPGNRPDSYRVIARRMAEVATANFTACPPRFIDLGGGFYSAMPPELERQFEYPIPTFDEYAEAIATELAMSYGPNGAPELLLEPGMALTADVMQLVAKVVDIKVIRERAVATVSSSIYDVKPTLHAKDMPITVVPAQQSNCGDSKRALDIVGYTCMEHDVLYKAYTGRLEVGDYVVFSNVGAYTTVLKPPFINPCPAIISENEETGEFELVKRRETSADIFSTYTF